MKEPKYTGKWEEKMSKIDVKWCKNVVEVEGKRS